MKKTLLHFEGQDYANSQGIKVNRDDLMECIGLKKMFSSTDNEKLIELAIAECQKHKEAFQADSVIAKYTELSKGKQKSKIITSEQAEAVCKEYLSIIQERDFSIVEDFFRKLLFRFLQSVDDNGTEDLYVGRSKTREHENIPLLCNFSEHDGVRLNGFVGVLTGTISDQKIVEEAVEECEKIFLNELKALTKTILEKKKIWHRTGNDRDESAFRNDISVFERKIRNLSWIYEKIQKKELFSKELLSVEADDITESFWDKFAPFCEKGCKEIVSILRKKEYALNLQVKSRYDAQNHAYLLATLLTYKTPGRVNEEISEWNEEGLFDFLLVDLLIHFLAQARMKGFYKTYQRFERNDNKLRGAIDIARHIRWNEGKNNGQIAYTYRENTTDNYLNALILWTYEYVKKMHPYLAESKLEYELKPFLDELKYSVDLRRYSPNSILAKNQRPISHPYFTEYERVRKICLRILRNEGISIFDSKDHTHDEGASGFLYYMPDLWEEFLEKVFKDCRKSEESKKWDFSAQYEDVSFIESNKPNQYFFQSRPDFVFYDTKNKKVFLILDAKFRPVWEDAVRKKSLQLEDFKGDVDKCLRDMAVNQTNGTGVIFPWGLKTQKDSELLEQTSIRRKISKVNDKQFFYIVPFGLPTEETVNSYWEWRKQFDQVIIEMRHSLLEIIHGAMQNGEEKGSQ